MTDTLTPPDHDISPISVEEEMRRSYLDYAMSVIVSRALPDVRDGLKPVHRRILYGMDETGNDWNRAYRKAARIVGDVMGKYHPHGDQAIYDAMVRMAQDFAMRLPLIDGQGNFGSMDGDPAAAMRYTEVRLAEVARALLDDIDKDTVDFRANYDDTTQEPAVLPARFPNLLVNGAGGIAVGMATNIPPHNLGEVIDACCAYVDNPEIEVDELMTHVPAPDFPTGGFILGSAGARAAYHFGRGSVVMRSRVHMEKAERDRPVIVVTEIPYQVNKSRLIEQIAEVARNKRVEGIAELRDESDRDGVRVVIELRREANADLVLNQLYRFTPLQTSFGVNMLALTGGRPELLGLRDVIASFVAFREEVITRRTKFELAKARERAEVLLGLAVAVANIDAVVALIRKAPDPATARERLVAEAWPAGNVTALIELIDTPGQGVVDGVYRLSDAQARAILDLRLQRLTALERDRISDELRSLVERIVDYLDILRSRTRLYAVLRDELVAIKMKFGTPRRTTLLEGEFDQDEEELIKREEMVITVTHSGYIKRVPLSTYRAQRRGGKGRAGMSTREADFVTRVFVVNTHTPVLFFSSTGKVYKLKAYALPVGTPLARGKAMVNVLPLAEGETIATLMPLPEDEGAWAAFVAVFATARGIVRPILLSKFSNVLSTGIIAIKLESTDRLIGVATATDADDVLLASRDGKCIRFAVAELRLHGGRATMGVRGMRLARDDAVISMSILHHVDADADERDAYLRSRRQEGRRDGETVSAPALMGISGERAAELAAAEEFVLSITENGYGKRTSAYEYRITARGGQGIINIVTSERNGRVVSSFPATDGDQIMLVTDYGQLIRTPVDNIRFAGRNTQGVTLFRTDAEERVVSVAWLPEVSVEDGDEETADEAETGGDEETEDT